MAKKKRLTQAEKKRNAKVKKELQEKGIIPPNKPRLNRKKFVEEAVKEWEECDKVLAFDVFILKAIFTIICTKDVKGHVSQEAVGVAKVLKLAVRLKQFSEKLEAENRLKYTVGEQYDYIKDILEA